MESLHLIVPFEQIGLVENYARSRENEFKKLLEKCKLPDHGWSDHTIESTLYEMASWDSNNLTRKSGIGEREGRVVSALVRKRHYGFAHGIGRSGNINEAQPKAIGSTVLYRLTNKLVTDLIQSVGMIALRKCILIPMATGMTITLAFNALKYKRKAEYVLWSRIDQKSCFKSILLADLIPIIIDPIQSNQGLITNLDEFASQIESIGAENILCIYSTTSCFAPRNCDKIIELSKLCKDHNIPHVINNAYGLQSTYYSHQIEQGARKGRVDFVIQSTDKNLLVPVGGAIIASPKEELIDLVSSRYAGRASASQAIDVYMTLLSLGKKGYRELMVKRKELFEYLHTSLISLATEHDQIVMNVPGNKISLALSLKGIDENKVTEIGSMLFIRNVFGVRAVPMNDIYVFDKTYEFKGWGSHSSEANVPYLTCACGLGVTKEEIDVFIKKLDGAIKTVSAKPSEDLSQPTEIASTERIVVED